MLRNHPYFIYILLKLKYKILHYPIRSFMHKYKQYIDTKVSLSLEDWQKLSQLYTLQIYQKGDTIITANNVCNYSYYLSQGIARSYFINENYTEITCGVHIHDKDNTNDIVLGDIKSILTQETSNIYCESLSTCHVYIAKLENIHQLFYDNIEWTNFVKVSTQERLVKTLQYQQIFAGLNATQRYIKLQEEYPHYEKTLTSYQLASVLGITPQSLSRIRAQLQR